MIMVGFDTPTPQNMPIGEALFRTVFGEKRSDPAKGQSLGQGRCFGIYLPYFG